LVHRIALTSSANASNPGPLKATKRIFVIEDSLTQKLTEIKLSILILLFLQLKLGKNLQMRQSKHGKANKKQSKYTRGVLAI